MTVPHKSLAGAKSSVADYMTQANILVARDDQAGLEDLLTKALADFPGHEEFTLKQARLLCLQNRFTAAGQLLKTLLRKNDRLAKVWSALGVVYWYLQDFPASAHALNKAIMLRPFLASAHFNRANLLLAQGKYETGWQEYEWRLRQVRFEVSKELDKKKFWRGEPLTAKTILVTHDNQGFGDIFFFSRLLENLRHLAHKILFAPNRATASLFLDSPYCDEVIDISRGIPEHDYHIPLPSLPHRFGITLDTVPVNIPYLWPDSGRVSKHRNLFRSGARLKVGLVWKSSNTSGSERAKSCELEDLTPLFSHRDIDFYSLQLGEEKAVLKQYPVTDLSPYIRGFADTAAMITHLDRVISIDTAVIHLAGALGIRSAVALPRIPPDWRWLAEGSFSPWYPETTVFRQPEQGNWAPVFDDIRDWLA